MTLHVATCVPALRSRSEQDMSVTHSTTEDVSCLTRGDIQVGVI